MTQTMTENRKSPRHKVFKAAKTQFNLIDRYDDAGVGTMGKNEHGKGYVAKVELNPSVVFGGANRPGEEDVAALHHRAHEGCYIAISVKSEVILAGATFSCSG